ncbi:MAG: serine/threonine protein kinase, partial [Kofleriaceae bacterium]
MRISLPWIVAMLLAGCSGARPARTVAAPPVPAVDPAFPLPEADPLPPPSDELVTPGEPTATP